MATALGPAPGVYEDTNADATEQLDAIFARNDWRTMKLHICCRLGRCRENGSEKWLGKGMTLGHMLDNDMSWGGSVTSCLPDTSNIGSRCMELTRMTASPAKNVP